MGREVRRVPRGWDHPRDEGGKYIPLLSGDGLAELLHWVEQWKRWQRGESWRGGVNCGWRKKTEHESQCRTMTEWDGGPPNPDEYMPVWEDSEAVLYQMYETCSEGTPISPAFETPEELAQWLVDNDASWFGDFRASYESWLDVANGTPGGGVYLYYTEGT